MIASISWPQPACPNVPEHSHCHSQHRHDPTQLFSPTLLPAKYKLTWRLLVSACHTDVYKIRCRRRQKPDYIIPPTAANLYFLTNVSQSILVGGNYISDNHPFPILQYCNNNLAVSDSSPYCVPWICFAYKNRGPLYAFHLPVYTHARAYSLERNNVNGSFSHDT